MIFDIAPRQEVSKIVQAVMIDARNSIGLKQANGNVIQAAVNAAVVAIGINPYFFSIESFQGSLVGYFYLNDNGTLKKKLLRPSYLKFESQISTQISLFISSGDWEFSTVK